VIYEKQTCFKLWVSKLWCDGNFARAVSNSLREVSTSEENRQRLHSEEYVQAQNFAGAFQDAFSRLTSSLVGLNRAAIQYGVPTTHESSKHEQTIRGFPRQTREQSRTNVPYSQDH